MDDRDQQHGETEELTSDWKISDLETTPADTMPSTGYGEQMSNVESMFDWTMWILILATLALVAGVALSFIGGSGAAGSAGRAKPVGI